MYFSDEAIICTNPELSSCRDSDKMIGFISSNSLRAKNGLDPVKQSLLVTRYDPSRAAKEESLSLEDIHELLGLPLVGVIPESRAVLTSTNRGQPVIGIDGDKAGEAYKDVVKRFLGQEIPLRYVTYEQLGFAECRQLINLLSDHLYIKSGHLDSSVFREEKFYRLGRVK